MTVVVVLLASSGCWKDDMADDGHLGPMEAPVAARPLVEGTVPRVAPGQRPRVVEDPIYAVTAPKGPPATTFPFAITAADLERGQRQYDIFCAVCHGATGGGDGMIVQRGFPRPPSMYLDRLRKAPHGHFYNVITHGYGAMYSYNDRVTPDDRWRIVAYIRALQLSDPQNTGLPTTMPAAPVAPVTPAPAH